jgi:hypothetical protein
MRNGIRVLLAVVALGTAGCQALRLQKDDSAPVKTGKVAGRLVQGVATGWISEGYYAGQRVAERSRRVE